MLEIKIYKRTPFRDMILNIKQKIKGIKRFFGIF